MIIAILFFSLASAVCIQLFAKSHLLSTQTVNQNHAVIQAQNLAESYLALEGDINAMQDLFSPSEQISDDTLRLTFDSCWNLCSAENGAIRPSWYILRRKVPVSWKPRSPCMTCLHRRCLFIQFLSCITPQRGGGTMSNSSKKRQFGMNIGSASILLVFVILCLVSFAVLSIVSANADSRLSTRVLERTTAYYDACNQAEQSLAGMDNTLRRVYEASDSEDAYYGSVGHGKSYVIPISDLQSLQVTIEILYPLSADDTFYRITAWQVLNTEDLQ